MKQPTGAQIAAPPDDDYVILNRLFALTQQAEELRRAFLRRRRGPSAMLAFSDHCKRQIESLRTDAEVSNV